jgi:hypothetical protein
LTHAFPATRAAARGREFPCPPTAPYDAASVLKVWDTDLAVVDRIACERVRLKAELFGGFLRSAVCLLVAVKQRAPFVALSLPLIKPVGAFPLICVRAV